MTTVRPEEPRMAAKVHIFGEAKSTNPLEVQPISPAHRPMGGIPNTPLMVSLIGFCLGWIFSLGVLSCVLGAFELLGPWSWFAYQLGFFVASWSGFHWAEFIVTAGWNREKLSIDSYLLNNGPQYHYANGTALAEFLLTSYFFPGFKRYPYLSTFGIALTLFGHFLRSTAMIHAATNFSHLLAFKKVEGHQLVTDGIYGWLRHPSYTGFFYWGLGTQLVLQNPVSFFIYWVVMWRFFSVRIRVEETQLVKFFGDDYVQYRKRVGTMIPFIA